jgi:RNAse (barnase) inhibitor barstar
MALVQIDSRQIDDWASFHKTCREAFGFPMFYGANLDALIDCLTYIDEGDGMSNVLREPDEKLRIEFLGSKEFRNRLPKILDGFVDAIESVNQRFADQGKQRRIALIML